MTMTGCQLFLANLPEESWGERNDKSVEFKNMDDDNIEREFLDNVANCSYVLHKVVLVKV